MWTTSTWAQICIWPCDSFLVNTCHAAPAKMLALCCYEATGISCSAAIVTNKMMYVQDVKAAVGEVLDSIRSLFVPCPADSPGTFRNEETYSEIAEMMAERLLEDRLHWREAFLTQLLLAHLVPVASDAKLVCLGMQAQLYSFLKTPSLVCKVCASKTRVCRRKLKLQCAPVC